MARLKWFSISVIFAILAVFSFNSDSWALEAGSPVGKVVAVRGDALAMDGSGASRRLTLKGPIFREDVLKTGKSGRLQILFEDQTLISLGRNTEMEIVRYAWEKDKKSGAMTTRVKEGAFRIMGGAITRNSPENFTTETPAATIGVRGSLYAGIFIGDMLYILFQGGTGLDLMTEFGSVPLTTPGFGCLVQVGGEPSTPGVFSPDNLQLIDDQFVPLGTVTGSDPGWIDGGTGATGGVVAGATGDPGTDPAPDEPLPFPPVPPWSLPPPLPPDYLPPNLLPQLTLVPVPVPFDSGRYLNTLVDSSNSNDNLWYGPITGTSDNGTATGQSVTQDTTIYPIDFPFTPHFPSSIYTGVNDSFGHSRTVNLVGTDRPFSSMAAHSGTAGEFGYFSTADSFVDGPNYDFWEFGFAGKESTALPTDGISAYFGEYLVTPRDSSSPFDTFQARTGGMIMVVNWLNGKVYGFVDEAGKPIMQFYGDVTGTGLAGVTFISDGAEAVGPGVKWHQGTHDLGQFYGTNGQGFGLAGLGSTYDIDTQALIETWRMAGAAFMDPNLIENFAPTGPITLDGMVVGLSEDMTSPNVNRRHFMSHPFGGSDFSFDVNQTTGNISGPGKLNAVDLLDPQNVLKNIDIGDAFGSAFIFHDVLVAGLGCTTNPNCIETGTTPDTGGLKTYGNYLAADGGPDRQIADHVSWGYWELAYDDPISGQPYHLHQPYSLWIAGVKTPAGDITAKIGALFTGRYLGRAYGSHVDNTGNATELTNGVTDLTIDFAAGATTPVSGNLNFDQGNIAVLGATAVFPGGFLAQISATTIGSANTISSSEVNGFFFEPGAAAMGGNFYATTADGEQLLGIMGGDLQP